MEFSLVQISVVVANIQVGILKAEVEKGFMRTAVDHELVDPKTQINLVNEFVQQCKKQFQSRKGKRLIFLYWKTDNLAATQQKSKTPMLGPGRVIFSC